MTHSIIEFLNGKARNLHCSNDATKAQFAFDKSERGLVIWFRMSASGGDPFKRVDHEANAAQAAKASADAEKAERDAEVRAEEELAYRVKQAATDAATQAVLAGEDSDGIAHAVTEAVEAVAPPEDAAPADDPADDPAGAPAGDAGSVSENNLSPQDNEAGEGASPSDDPASTSAENSTAEDESAGEEE